MMKPEKDAFGQMVRAYHNDPADVYEVIEREDGFIDVLNPKFYFSTYDDWLPLEQDAIALAQGRILDVGCGAGRHCLYLQEQGHDVVGIDNSPLAIEVCRERGVKDARVIPVTQLDSNLNPFDSIIMFGNNFGLMGNYKRAKWLLRRFHAMTTSGARIIAATQDIYTTTSPMHLAYQQHNRDRGRMSGQIRFRVRFQQYKGDWLDYLMVSVDEMRDIVNGTGWQIAQIVGDAKPRYFAVLEKSQ